MSKPKKWVEVSRRFVPPNYWHGNISGDSEAVNKVIHGFTVIEMKHRQTGDIKFVTQIGDLTSEPETRFTATYLAQRDATWTIRKRLVESLHRSITENEGLEVAIRIVDELLEEQKRIAGLPTSS